MSDNRSLFSEDTLTEEELLQLKQSSSKFVGKWNKLISSTNWDKGAIIISWRDALIEKGSAATEYSDEAWSKIVGGVTSQHVGRLRRVSQRFGGVQKDYKGLYWTHFCAAIEWEDAEMWLEGAVQNKWSVSKMRNQRWETMGAIEKDRPDDADIVVGSLDEDYEPSALASPDSDKVVGRYDEIASCPRYDGPDFGDEDETGAALSTSDSKKKKESEKKDKVDPVRPFEDIEELPEDLAEAFEAFKLAILNHKAAEWEEISCKELIKCIDALKILAKAP